MDFQIQRDIPTVEPDTLGMIGNFTVTNATMMILLIVALVLIVSFLTRGKYKLIPGSIQNFIEVIYEGMVDMVEQITGDKERAVKIFPLIGTLFVFIGIANLINFIPGLGNITYSGVSLFRTATTDFNTTFGLAFAMIVLIQIISLRGLGLFGYLGKFFKFKGVVQGFSRSIGDGFVALIEFFVGLLDIISEFAKIISLSLRLFGNIYAGEVLAIIILGAFAVGLPATWLALNLLFALVQALVFGSLVTAYYSLAASEIDEYKRARLST